MWAQADHINLRSKQNQAYPVGWSIDINPLLVLHVELQLVYELTQQPPA